MNVMNFHEAQGSAKRQTTLFVLLFTVAVFLLCLASMLVVGIAFGVLLNDQGQIDLFGNSEHMLPVGAIVLLIVAGGSLSRWLNLRAGGSAVAKALGGVELPERPADPRQRMLQNVVEEMALAASLPVPAVYVLPESGINAFAAGNSPQDAAIGVTQGAIETLSRDELQGVIGHEFSHILGGDMTRNIRLTGLLGGIFALGVTGYIALRIAPSLMSSRGRRNDKGQLVQAGIGAAIALCGLGLMLVGAIGTFFGRWIQSAISRQREFLADANAAQFTRNPDGLARALIKIRDTQTGSRVRAKHAGEYSHFFFAAGLKGGFASLFATHPPIDERIRRLDPDGSEASSRSAD